MARRWHIAKLFLQDEDPGPDVGEDFTVSDWHDVTEKPECKELAKILFVMLFNGSLIKSLYFSQFYGFPNIAGGSNWFYWDSPCVLTDVQKWAYIVPKKGFQNEAR